MTLAAEKLSAARKEADATLEARQVAIDSLLKPVKESLERAGREIQDMEKERGQAYGRNAEHLNRRLKANGWKPGETLHFERVEGGTHDEASWARRVRPMLRFLFPAG